MQQQRHHHILVCTTLFRNKRLLQHEQCVSDRSFTAYLRFFKLYSESFEKFLHVATLYPKQRTVRTKSLEIRLKYGPLNVLPT